MKSDECIFFVVVVKGCDLKVLQNNQVFPSFWGFRFGVFEFFWWGFGVSGSYLIYKLIFKGFLF